MDFRASGQSNQRRRRVRSDEHAAASIPMHSKGHGSGEKPRARRSRYSEGGRPDNQPRLADLVPRSWLMQSVLAVGIFVVLALLGTWHAAAQGNADTWPAEIVRMADATRGDSLASWIRAALLAGASMLAVLIYVTRRHRTDDYGGRYRIWLWAAVWFAVMCADQVARLRDAVAAVGVVSSGWTGPADGALWWAAPCALAALAIGVRLGLDMRECTASAIAFSLSAVLWTCGEVLPREAHIPQSASTDFVGICFSLAGQWLLVVSLTLHARHVVLDAAGLIGKKKRRTATPSSNPEPAATHEEGRSGQAAKESTIKTEPARADLTTTAKSVNKPEPQPAPTLTFGGRTAPPEQKLSKAERKALKNQLRRAA